MLQPKSSHALDATKSELTVDEKRQIHDTYVEYTLDDLTSDNIPLAQQLQLLNYVKDRKVFPELAQLEENVAIKSTLKLLGDFTTSTHKNLAQLFGANRPVTQFIEQQARGVIYDAIDPKIVTINAQIKQQTEENKKRQEDEQRRLEIAQFEKMKADCLELERLRAENEEMKRRLAELEHKPELDKQQPTHVATPPVPPKRDIASASIVVNKLEKPPATNAKLPPAPPKRVANPLISQQAQALAQVLMRKPAAAPMPSPAAAVVPVSAPAPDVAEAAGPIMAPPRPALNPAPALSVAPVAKLNPPVVQVLVEPANTSAEYKQLINITPWKTLRVTDREILILSKCITDISLADVIRQALHHHEALSDLGQQFVVALIIEKGKQHMEIPGAVNSFNPVIAGVLLESDFKVDGLRFALKHPDLLMCLPEEGLLYLKVCYNNAITQKIVIDALKHDKTLAQKFEEKTKIKLDPSSVNSDVVANRSEANFFKAPAKQPDLFEQHAQQLRDLFTRKHLTMATGHCYYGEKRQSCLALFLTPNQFNSPVDANYGIDALNQCRETLLRLIHPRLQHIELSCRSKFYITLQGFYNPQDRPPTNLLLIELQDPHDEKKLIDLFKASTNSGKVYHCLNFDRFEHHQNPAPAQVSAIPH
jgi:hypothetical protein